MTDAPPAGVGHLFDAGWRPFVEVPVRASVVVLREQRDRCVNCQLRRVLYRIAVITAAGEDRTERRCGPCWGIR